jgi:hypothetical protein
VLKFLDELLRQYFWCIVGTFGKFWNESNEYGMPKNILKQCNSILHCKKGLFKRLEMIWKWFFFGKVVYIFTL